MNSLPGHLQQMQKPEFYPHAVDQVQVIETHISWLILTGPYVYKIKKNISLDFLDYSSLENRKYFCQEEVRLNQRFAPNIYLEVTPIYQLDGELSLHPHGQTIEYAVKMKQFPPNSQLDQLITKNELHPEHVSLLANNIATIHQSLPSAPSETAFGNSTTVLDAAIDNFSTIAPLINAPKDLAQLQTLRDWTIKFVENNTGLFEERKLKGAIRECHGDLHLGNITMIDGSPVIFDCIEFNDEFRSIDVISDIAFLVMDLYSHGKGNYARRLLNQYLEITGDYQGLKLLQFYLIYRAMVRCKVESIKLHQENSTQVERYQKYLNLALQFMCTNQPALLITHGLSGSGKTVVSQLLIEQSNTIRIRSDVERKRLHGLSNLASSNDEQKKIMYSDEATHRTYEHLATLCKDILSSHNSVIVDATFLKKNARDFFAKLAIDNKVPFLIVHTEAPIELLTKWIKERQACGNDASEATIEVLKGQISRQEPLTPCEVRNSITINTEHAVNGKQLLEKINTFINTSTN